MNLNQSNEDKMNFQKETSQENDLTPSSEEDTGKDCEVEDVPDYDEEESSQKTRDRSGNEKWISPSTIKRRKKMAKASKKRNRRK